MSIKRITASIVTIAMSAGMFTVMPIPASADDTFVGMVSTPQYIESEGDTYDNMYEYTVGGETADKWYYDQSPSITLDNDTMYNINVKEYCVSGTSTSRGLYFILRKGDGTRFDNTNYLQNSVMATGATAETELKNIKGEIGTAILEMKIICFEPGSVLRVGISTEEVGYRVTAGEGVELVGAESGDYIAKGSTVDYAYNGKMYTSIPITSSTTINSANAAEKGTETGEAVKITAAEGVELINVPENGYILPGAKVRYTYNGDTYLTDAVNSSTEIGAESGAKVEEEYSKYLFVHFVGKDNSGNLDNEKIYFSVSSNAVDWSLLNGGEPILSSTLGTKGVRDPHIVRSPDGDGFHIIATDLLINQSRNWTDAQYNASKKIMIWDSSDLVNWSDEREYEIGADIEADSVGCVWAPESIWDKEEQKYMVFWASMTKLNGETDAKQRIFRSYTSDFRTFTKPELYIERDNHVIDTTILEQDGVYYRYSKDETTKKVGCEYATSLDGPWKATKLAIGNVEGPTAFKFNNENKWGVFVDSLGAGWSGYGMMVTDNLYNNSYTYNATTTDAEPLRHGTVIPITEAEYNALVSAYPMTEPEPTESPAVYTDNRYSFSSDTTASNGAVNNGDVTEWKITSSPEYFYIDQADFDALEKITIHSGHGGSTGYSATYKIYAYDSEGEDLSTAQLAEFKTDNSVLGTEIAKVTDSNDAWGYNTITIDKTSVTQDKGDGNYTLDTANSSPLSITEGTGTKALILGVEYTSESPVAYFDYITLSYNSDNEQEEPPTVTPTVTPTAVPNTLRYGADYSCAAYFNNAVLTTGEDADALTLAGTAFDRSKGGPSKSEEGYFVAYAVLDISNVDIDTLSYSAVSPNNASPALKLFYTDNEDIVTTAPKDIAEDGDDDMAQSGPSYNLFKTRYGLTEITADSESDIDVSAAKDAKYLVIVFRGWPTTTLNSFELTGVKTVYQAEKIVAGNIDKADTRSDAVGYYVRNILISGVNDVMKWALTMNDGAVLKKSVNIPSLTGSGNVSFGIIIYGSNGDYVTDDIVSAAVVIE